MAFRELCRFEREDFREMCSKLRGFGDANEEGLVKTSTRCVYDPCFGVFLLARRLAVPDRWCDIERSFNLRYQWLSAVFMDVLHRLTNEYSRVITKVDIIRLLPLLGTFADAVSLKTEGTGLADVVCFVDGKFCRTCRPTNMRARDYQRSVYNGHYRGHGLKIQSVVWADGMLNLFVDSSRVHDSLLLTSSGILDSMEIMFINGDASRPALMYGDPAYGDGIHLARKHKGPFRSKAQVVIDNAMVPVRTEVEHTFSKLVALWPLLDFCKKHKLWSTATAEEWIIGAFLTNIHTCYYCSQMNSFVGVSPPSMAEYLHSVHENLM